MSDIPNVANGQFSIANGFLLGTENQSAGDFTGFDGDSGYELSAFTADGELYYTKMAELCKAHGIALILYSQPLASDYRRYNAYRLFADSLGVTLIDFNTRSVAADAGIDWHTDIGGHQSTVGAIKTSRYIGKYLHEHYALTDVRGDPRYSYLDDQYRQYMLDLNMILLRSTSEIDGYLAMLNNPRYTIFIAAKDEASAGLKDSSQKLLFDLGLEKQLQGAFQQAYIAVIESGGVVVERLTDSAPEFAWTEFNGTLATGSAYTVRSAGNQAGNQVSIVIDGNEYAIDSRGLNFVVYDHEQQAVIDRIVFDTGGDNTPIR
jgi:hypothetical protein